MKRDICVELPKELIDRSIELHRRLNRASVENALEVGDLVIRCLLALEGMATRAHVIRLLRRSVRGYAQSTSYYNDAARMAGVLNEHQRKVLVNRNVPKTVVDAICATEYDRGSERAQVISYIGKGRIVAPWTSIRGSRAPEFKRQARHGQTATTVAAATDPFTGMSVDGISDYLASWASRSEENLLILREAVVRAEKARAKAIATADWENRRTRTPLKLKEA